MKSSINDGLNIYLVRHGRTIMNTLFRMQGWCDSPLTPEGKQKAFSLGRGLNDISFDAAYCSTLRRTLETSSLILDAKGQKGLPITELQGLNEMCFGFLEAMDESQAWRLVSKEMGYHPETNQLDEDLFAGKISMQDIYKVVQGLDTLGMAETWETVEERVYKSIEQIALTETQKGSKNILIVSHGNSIATFLMKLGCKEIPKKPIENLSVSEIKFSSNHFQIKTVADLSYLPKN